MGYKLENGYSEKRKSDYLALTMPGADYARRDYLLGDGYSLAEIRKRILTKERVNTVPYLPPLQLPFVPVEKLSRFQVRLLSRVKQAYRYRDYALPAAAQARVRKDLLKIEKLQEDCRYLITKGLRTEEDIQERLKNVKAELRGCYMRRNVRQNQLEACGEAGTVSGDGGLSGYDLQIQILQQEKKILRRLLRESEVTWQVTPLEPIRNPDREKRMPGL